MNAKQFAVWDAHQKAISQHCEEQNVDVKEIPVEFCKPVGIGVENGLNKLVYVMSLQNGIQYQYDGNVSLEESMLGPHSIIRKSFGSMVEVQDTVDGEGQESAIDNCTQCHP